MKNKVVFVASFNCNTSYVVNKTKELTTYDVVILNASKRKNLIKTKYNIEEIKFRFCNIHSYIIGIYHLATSKYVFVDNYFPFLVVTNFKKDVKCVQLWHAVGAIKKFGLVDESLKLRHPSSKNRYKKVYNRFDKIVVGSKKMGDVFIENFDIDNNKILYTGVPRTDFFYDEVKIKNIKKSLYEKYNVNTNKKIILYAPTYRNGKFSVSDCALDIEQMYSLKDDYVLLLKFHPLVLTDFSSLYKDFVIEVSGLENINKLLTITDILITDYSSIPFEFSLYEKPMIFYAYDLEDYKKNTGLIDNFESFIPGPIVKTTKDVVKHIKEDDFNIQKIKMFSKEWNEFSVGNSSENLIDNVMF
jgi:CDP-glycerol glycerophosphotransferase (TagB/SpsB family)